MARFEVISFDAEGTLVTHRLSDVVWLDAVPELWARQNGVSPEEAKAKIRAQYDEVGDRRVEWYDIHYWFRLLGLDDPAPLLQKHRHESALFPEVIPVLESLQGQGRLVVCSGSGREFLDIQLGSVRHHFEAVFSSVSDYGELKNEHFYTEVCRRLGVSPEQVVHVGDSRDFDYEMPRRLGIATVLLSRRHGGDGDAVANLTEFAARLSQL